MPRRDDFGMRFRGARDEKVHCRNEKRRRKLLRASSLRSGFEKKIQRCEKQTTVTSCVVLFFLGEAVVVLSVYFFVNRT